MNRLRREFNKILDGALKLLDRLDAVVANSITDNEQVMAAWDIARHVERIPRKRQSKSKPGKPEDAVSNNGTSSGDAVASTTA